MGGKVLNYPTKELYNQAKEVDKGNDCSRYY